MEFNGGYQSRPIEEDARPLKTERPVRYSPRVVAQIKGQPMDWSPERAVNTGPVRVYDPATDRRVPKKGKASTKEKAQKPKSSNMSTQFETEELVLEEGTPPAGIQSTKKYSIFKLLPTNRKVDPQHVRKLVAAIRKKNLLHLNPILVNSRMEVIEGQHRLEAAKQLKVPIYWVQDAGVSQEDIAALNSNKKNWGMMDYIHFYAEQGKQAYLDFQSLCADYPQFPPALLVKLCGKDGGAQRNALQTGGLDVSNMPAAEETIRQLKEISGHFELAHSARFIEAFAFIVATGDYDHGRMMQRLEMNPGALQACANKRQYIQSLQHVYNKGVREANIVIFLKR